MAGAMWDLEAKAVAGAARDRGEPVVVIGGEEIVRWRKATEPVIAAWQKQMRERKLDGGKLLADVHASAGKVCRRAGTSRRKRRGGRHSLRSRKP